ncbi:cytochrome P450 [Lepidopterella palustris CBS 459.81]|uniref:Cytochrome P450 n=1 Tax=Lepidopterella palustris CBS 459.81 TaxID=1314670 RepID=A0A8E2DXP1_9PEZI|nr:cytochrome P450 [Lepidopterella palustris CBS 459.81]
MTGTGPKLVLPNRFANELSNHPDLPFTKAVVKDFFVHYPGFQPLKLGLHDDALIQETVRVKLTQSLALITEDLVDETAAAQHDLYGENYDDWTTVSVLGSVTDIVARVVSRVLLGRNLCRNPHWLKISKSYTADAFRAATQLRRIPALVRPFVFWFLPSCKVLRNSVRDAHQLIDPEVERRKRAVNEALRVDKKPPKVADAIGWMHEISVARGYDVDYVASQLMLSLAATHTTASALALALFDACDRPGVIQALRKEIIEVVGQYGWSRDKAVILKLMDSFLKETQRVQPMNATNMNRWVERDIKLSNGIVLPKDSRIMVMGEYMDPKLYPEPEKFDAARFLRMRKEQPGSENVWQYVSGSPNHMLFGLGQHACPGRFFAANVIKIAMCHMLLKYDWRLVPGEGRPPPMNSEVNSSLSYTARLQCRRRREEIHLDHI